MTGGTSDKGTGPKKGPSGSRRSGPTIELKATEVASQPIAHEPPVAAEKPETVAAERATPESSPPRPDTAAGGVPPRGPDRFAQKIWGRVPGGLPWPLIGAGAVAAIVFFLLGLAAANLLAGRAVTTDSAPERNRTADDLSQRIARLESALAVPRAPDAGLTGRIAAAEAAARLAAEQAAAQQRRADELAVLVREARARSDSALAAAETAQKGTGVATSDVARGDIDALNNRIAALEQALKASEAERRSAGVVDDRKSGLAVVASVLSMAVDRGASFTAELAAARALAPDAGVLAPLEPFAAAGVPSAQALSRELAALTPALLKAAGNAAPQDGGILDKLQANAERLVRIRPVGDVSGDRPADVIARIEAKAARADLAGALQDLSKLPAPVRAPADPWIRTAEARAAALAAARQFSMNALAAVGKPNM